MGYTSMLLRPITKEDILKIASIHVAAWKSTYKNILPADYLSALSVPTFAFRWRERLATDPPAGFNILAETGDGRIVGFASGGPEKTVIPRLWGELSAIYIDPGFQRKGAGTLLFNSAVEKLRDHRYKGMISWMLAGNPAAGFYTRMGGTAQGAKMEAFGGVKMEVVAYEWSFK